MVVDKIRNIISQSNRNIVFYFDIDGTFKDELEEIANSGIKVVEVSNNYFELKYKLEFEWQKQELFIYHPFPKPNDKDIKKYPLLDLLKANAELRLDDASEFLSEYKLPEYHLTLVKRYIKQLKTKTNQKKLAKILDPAHFNEPNLKLGLISLALDFSTVSDRNSCMAKCLSLVNDDKDFSKAEKMLKQLELEQDVLNWFNILLDTSDKEFNKETIIGFARKLKYNVLTSYIDKPVKADNYAKLKITRVSEINKLQAFFQDWENHPTLKGAIDIVFSNIAHDINTENLMLWYGSDQEFGYYSEEMLTALIKDLYKGIVSNPEQTKDDCIKWLRSKSLADELSEQIRFIYHTGGVYSILNNYRSFKLNTADEFVEKYTKELHGVDYNFRKAVIAFDKVQDRLYEFEDDATSVFEALNQKYDRFLIELNVEWQQTLNDNKFNYNTIQVNKQYDFYKNNLKDFDFKMVVIISDALRYELGHELFNDLLADSKNNLTIEPCLASIPSYTNIGMANLLPNKGINIEKGESDLVFKIGDKTTVSTNREAILQATEQESSTIDYSEVRKMTKQKKRAFFKENKITYIYHDWIDAIGDKKRTEHQTFEATEKAVEDLKWLIRNITGEVGIAHVLVTSDHGFLYNYNEMKETSREALPKIKGYGRDHVRFVVADDFEGEVDGYQFNLKETTNIDTDLKVAVPRAINRYRKQGNVGVQFVHGGASLQELITPVIKFYKHKKETLQTVSFQRIDSTDKISSGSMKVIVIQDQPVSNEFKSAELVFGLYSDTGELLSNEAELHLNSVSSNPKERLFEVILSLNTAGSKASFGRLRAYDKKDKTRLNPVVVNDLIKISSLMEKDEF
ncbi:MULTISPECIES: BREX-1 system phosphatase PglZ type A [unclassified Carboxylicivirga]|uniref:BREX-1 system phosphatase PglZ type A n=1 Tax=Carboxylicivirga TaxID=1628153 RepID=UPI003D34E9A3